MENFLAAPRSTGKPKKWDRSIFLGHIDRYGRRGTVCQRKTLSAVLNRKAGISPEMAIRLSIAFDTSAESWLNQQAQYELWHAEQPRCELNVKKLVAA